MHALTNPARPADGGDLAVDSATLYPEDDGFFGRRAKARRAKLLGGVADVVRRTLAPGETVRYVGRGVRYHLLEHVFGGAAVAQYHNMTALVLTDRRLLLVQLDRRGRAADIKNEVPLAAIRGAGRKGFSFRIQLADGTKLSFVQMSGADKKRFGALRPAAAGPRTAERSLVHLCPACLGAVPGPVGVALVCPREDCRVPFRDPRRAARLSALVPGLGDLYLRHHFFGSIEFLGSMAMLGVAIAFLVQAVAGGETSSVAGAAILGVLLVGVPRVIDHRLTLHMGRKGLVPLALAPAPGAQARNLPSYPRWSPLLFVAGLALSAAVALFIARDLGGDAAVRQASALAAQGRLDDARARWDAIERDGGADEAGRVRFALALLDAGDLEGAGELQGRFDGSKIDAELAKRWNAAIAREQAALAEYRAGVEALVGGDASAWTHLDPALEYFRGVKRPHLPQSRAEVHAHLAERVLREPLAEGDLDRARRWLGGISDAPAPEVAAVRAAFHSASGESAEARAALAAVEGASLPLSFRLLALEARSRLVESDADRAALRQAAEAFPAADLDDEDAQRLRALISPVK
jgi:hypothetical protein